MSNKEYIDRDSIYSRVKRHTNPYGKPTLDYKSGVKVLDMIKQEPTADVVEVIHSEWILNDDGSATCKNCYMTTKYAWDYDNVFNYCPHCSAKMDGDTNNAK